MGATATSVQAQTIFLSDYEITGQSQGIIGGPLRVIVGDKKGGGQTKLLSRDPNLLRRLQEEVEFANISDSCNQILTTNTSPRW